MTPIYPPRNSYVRVTKSPTCQRYAASKPTAIRRNREPSPKQRQRVDLNGLRITEEEMESRRSSSRHFSVPLNTSSSSASWLTEHDGRDKKRVGRKRSLFPAKVDCRLTSWIRRRNTRRRRTYEVRWFFVDTSF